MEWRINKWHVRNIQIVNIAKKIIIVHTITCVMEVLGVEIQCTVDNCKRYECISYEEELFEIKGW